MAAAKFAGAIVGAPCVRRIPAAAFAAMLLLSAGLPPPVANGEVRLAPELLTAPIGLLRGRIEQDTANVGKSLSPDAREALQKSLSRFYRWVDAYCGAAPESAKDPTTPEASCFRNRYLNYLARIPSSVYRVGSWTVYETGVYGLLWPDDDLQRADLKRAFTWNLEVIWPRIDGAEPGLPGKMTSALSERVHSLLSQWVIGGWDRYVDIRFEAVNDCYASASITESTYGGGAHPNGDIHVFNWNRAANRPLENGDLFDVAMDWQSGVLKLYKKHLQALPEGIAGATSSADEDLRRWISSGYVVTDDGVRIIEHEGRSRAERVPSIDIPWSELAPWLAPSVRCAPNSTVRDAP